MPIELFGISIGRAKKEALSQATPVEKKAQSFVLPDLDDAMPVDAGGYYGIGIDLDGSLRSEAQFITKYREMSMHPEIEQANINESFGPVPFDSNILKEILKANKDYHSGEIRISKNGLLDAHLHCGGPLYTGYYLVRKQENN